MTTEEQAAASKRLGFGKFKKSARIKNFQFLEPKSSPLSFETARGQELKGKGISLSSYLNLLQRTTSSVKPFRLKKSTASLSAYTAMVSYGPMIVGSFRVCKIFE